VAGGSERAGVAVIGGTLLAAAPTLATVNAGLNFTAALLLIAGFALIRRGRVGAHRNAMLAAFTTSIVFLGCYLYYHFQPGHATHRFAGSGAAKAGYYALLVSHIVLAAVVPFLASATIWLGLADRRAAHRRLARWTFPIWMYVSITGVLIYGMLYHWPWG
jgi:uncharacterized membrane protein YozB (DUF420 family)